MRDVTFPELGWSGYLGISEYHLLQWTIVYDYSIDPIYTIHPIFERLLVCNASTLQN